MRIALPRQLRGFFQIEGSCAFRSASCEDTLGRGGGAGGPSCEAIVSLPPSEALIGQTSPIAAESS